MKDGLLKCSRHHLKCKEACENSTCRYWISYEDEQNCSLISIYENGPMTLRDIAERMGVSFARVKQIQRNNFPQPCSRNRSHFKCTKLCHFYKNNWPGTNISMCEHVEEHLKAFGEAETVEKCTREGFNIGYYEAPG